MIACLCWKCHLYPLLSNTNGPSVRDGNLLTLAVKERTYAKTLQTLWACFPAQIWCIAPNKNTGSICLLLHNESLELKSTSQKDKHWLCTEIYYVQQSHSASKILWDVYVLSTLNISLSQAATQTDAPTGKTPWPFTILVYNKGVLMR